MMHNDVIHSVIMLHLGGELSWSIRTWYSSLDGPDFFLAHNIAESFNLFGVHHMTSLFVVS